MILSVLGRAWLPVRSWPNGRAALRLSEVSGWFCVTMAFHSLATFYKRYLTQSKTPMPRLPDRRPEVYAVPAIAGVILAVWIVSEVGSYVVGLWNWIGD